MRLGPVNEPRAAEPLVDMKMMRIRGVWTVNAAAFLVGAGMYCSFILIPQFVETPTVRRLRLRRVASRRRGCSCCPRRSGCCSSARWRAAWPSRVGSRVPLILGSLATAPGVRVPRASRTTIRWEFYVGAALLGIGIGLAFASLANLIVEAVPPATRPASRPA